METTGGQGFLQSLSLPLSNLLPGSEVYCKLRGVCEPWRSQTKSCAPVVTRTSPELSDGLGTVHCIHDESSLQAVR